MSLFFAVALAIAAPVEANAAALVVTYGCDDVVVVGKMTNVSYSLIEDDNDVLGHGHIKFKVHVKQRLAGRDARRILSAATVAHGYMNEENEFLLVLRPVRGKREYWLQNIRLWKLAPGEYDADMPKPPPRPTLAARCS